MKERQESKIALRSTLVVRFTVGIEPPLRLELMGIRTPQLRAGVHRPRREYHNCAFGDELSVDARITGCHPKCGADWGVETKDFRADRVKVMAIVNLSRGNVLIR